MNHVNQQDYSTASTVSAVRSSRHQGLTAFYVFFHMITCATICFFWATALLLSTTLHPFHFHQIGPCKSSVASSKLDPQNFLERPRLRRVKTGTHFCIWPWTNYRIKERRHEQKTENQKLISITHFLSHLIMNFLPSLKVLMLSLPLCEWWMPRWGIIMLL